MSRAPTIDELLRTGAAGLAGRSDSPGLDARLLLGKVLGCDRAALAARPERTVSATDAAAFRALLAERRAGVPVAYLTGVREFWSLPFAVSPAVLVPRPETELLVATVLERLPADAPCAVLDLGTGSGVIAIAIAKERPRSRVTATDVSAEALAIARSNAASIAFDGDGARGSTPSPASGSTGSRRIRPMSPRRIRRSPRSRRSRARR